MYQLNPSEVFLLARQLEDSADTATYYIQSVVKDVNNTTLDTINLTDRGSQFFSKSYTVPADTTGNGRWITIQSTVYTDASYSTKSTLYGTRLDSYLIQQRTNANLALGGGGADISYKKVRDIIKEEIGKIEMPQHKEMDMKPMMNKMSDMEKRIDNIYLDTSPLEKKITGIEKSIQDIPKPLKPKEINLSPILVELSDVQDSLKMMDTMMTDEMGEYSKKLDGLSEKIDNMEKDFDKNLKQLPIVTTMDDVEKFMQRIKKEEPKETMGTPKMSRVSFKELFSQ